MGFLIYLRIFSASGKVKIKTEAKKAEELFSNFNAEVEIAFSAPKIDLNSFKLLF